MQLFMFCFAARKPALPHCILCVECIYISCNLCPLLYTRLRLNGKVNLLKQKCASWQGFDKTQKREVIKFFSVGMQNNFKIVNAISKQAWKYITSIYIIIYIAVALVA